MKRFLTLLLLAALLVPAFPTYAGTEMPTFTIAIGRHTLDKSDGMASKFAAKHAEETTGIHIEWIEMESGTEAERTNIMIASGDLPDAFLSLLSESILTKNFDSFLPLNDLIATNAPHIQEQYDRHPELWDMLTMTNGNLYTLATSWMVSPDNQADGIQFINKAWLDQLGLAVPTNTEEYYNALVAVKNGDPNGNGVADELPVMFCENNWAAHITNFMGPWGFTGYSKIENGQFIFTPKLPEFRSFLQFYAKLAAEGLIDVEGFTQTNQQYYAKLKESITLTYCGWTPSSNLEPAVAAEFVALTPLQSTEYPDIRPVTAGEKDRLMAGRFGFGITTACKDPATLLSWFDAQNADTRTKMEWLYGEEGTLWEMDENGKAWTIFPETSADFTRENMKYTYGFVGKLPALILPEEREQDNGEKYPEAVVRLGLVDAVKDYFPKEALPIRSVPEEKINERTLIATDLTAYLNTFVADCIVNGIDDAKWEAHLVAVDSYGAVEWTQWYQDFLDGKF